MTRKTFVMSAFIVVCLLVASSVLLPIFDSVTIIAPMKGILIIISRNHHEVSAGQVLSVKYHFSETYLDPTELIRDDTLRDAQHSDDHAVLDHYIIGAPFDIIREGHFPPRVRVEPAFRSVFARVAFTDGKTVSLSYPLEPVTHEAQAIYVDLADDSP